MAARRWSTRGSARGTTPTPRPATPRAPTTPPTGPWPSTATVAVAVGTSTYSKRAGGPVTRVFDNCFVIRFDADGRCREFTEWFVERPTGADA